MDHYTVDFEPDDAGWYGALCNCGWSAGGIFPSAEDAADALMEHAFEAGRIAETEFREKLKQTDA